MEALSTPPVFFDSIARRPLPPPDMAGKPISFYACGITPYAPAHIGHARSFVVFDLMARVLRAHGHEVVLVRNITDIDDKIIAAAHKSGQAWHDLSHGFARRNDAELDRLDLLPYEQPMASQHIPQIVALIKRLFDRGHAYLAPTGDVLFEVATFQDRGASLMPHAPRDLLAHGSHRVSSQGKRSPLDFVLWKPAKPGEPAWESPWGRGRPGWHIECSAMVQARFGDTLTYHGGGNDLRFPHHQAEIQQSEAAYDRPLAHRWVHHGAVHDHLGRKMSKSLGNTVELAQVLEHGDRLLPGAGGKVVRLALLSTLWTRPLDWSPSLLEAAASHLASWNALAQPADHGLPASFLTQLSNNLNSPKAWALMHGWARQARAGNAQQARWLGQALTWLDLEIQALRPAEKPVPTELLDLLARRSRLRAKGDWQGADVLRQEVARRGYEIRDTAHGSELVPR